MSHHAYLPPEVDEAVRSFIRRHKHGLRWGCLAAVILALLLTMVVAWGLLRGAARMKDWVGGKAPAIRLPLQWDQPLGDAALAQLRGQFRFVNDQQVLEPLNQLAAPLFAGRTNATDRFTLFGTESKQINALALPGGYIVFQRGLLERARTAEELQGVLAHEMAYVQKRHGLLPMAQHLGLDLGIQQLQGGESRVLDTLVRDSGQLLGLKFSRDHERAAHDGGWEMLEQAQINPRGMVDFIAGLKAALDPGGAPAMALLSTHPAPQERMDRLRAKAAGLAPRELRSFTREFKGLQAAWASPFELLEKDIDRCRDAGKVVTRMVLKNFSAATPR